MAIRILSDETINKIAAGEVIEDPSSVVKELVDNALDAKASEIKVSITAGGFQEIIVSDNGEGMDKNDAIMCIERHATKKIQKACDLLSIDTMGFRGEALAAIASICKLEICTSRSDLGHEVQVHAGKILGVVEKARQKGSSFRVQKLFFNTPARKKFQKSVAHATSKIVDLMAVMALSNPMIAFDFSVDHKSIFAHRPNKAGAFLDLLKQTVSAVLHSDYLTRMSQVDIKKGGYHLKGFVGSMLDAKTSRKGQYLFINKRVVESKLLADTITSSFSTRIQSNGHIPFVLFLKMPFDLVDVNVHPKKIHVRFSDPSAIQNFVYTAMQEVLEKANPFKSELNFAPKDAFFSESIKSTAENFTFENFVEAKSTPLNNEQVEAFDDIGDHVFGLFKNFLLLRDFLGKTDKLLILDLKRAQKTLAYRQLQKSLSGINENLATQGLLKSQSLQVDPDLYVIIKANLSYFAKLGIDLRDFGSNTFMLEALFEGYNEARVLELIESLALSIRKERGVRLEKFMHISCQYSVKSGSCFSLQEALFLVKKVLQENKGFKDHMAVPFLVNFDQKQFDYLANLGEELCIV